MQMSSGKVGLALVLAFVAGPAMGATPMVVAFSTWLQAGPGAGTRVLDELPGGWRVDVVSCAEGWCRVTSGRAEGYVREALLAPGRAVVPVAVAGGACFPGEHLTPEGALALRFCEGRR